MKFITQFLSSVCMNMSRRRHQYPPGEEHLRLFTRIVYEHQKFLLKRA